MSKPYSIVKKDINGNTEYQVKIHREFSLFKIRAINDYNINALVNNEVWASNPITFNDPYDCSLYVSKKSYNEFFEKHIEHNKEFLETNQIDIKKEKESFFIDAEMILKLMN